MSARRYNKGKLRLELLPPNAIEMIAEVYTLGAHKYTIYEDSEGNRHLGKDISLEQAAGMTIIDDGANNWKRGLNWSGAMASVKRHIHAWEKGEDIDADLGTMHLANAAWGLIALLDFYKRFPQGDDRDHRYLNMPKIGLDIDEVLADWVGAWSKRFRIEMPTAWHFDREITKKFDRLRKEEKLDDFYLSLKPLIDPADIHFEPHCYVTSRPVDSSVSEKWLDKHGFPARPVHTVGLNQTKVDVIREAGVEIFVDDKFDNFVEINKAGICCYLYDAPHNQRYDAGHKRIYNISDLLTFEHLKK